MMAAISRNRQPAIATVENAPKRTLLKFDFDELFDEEVDREQAKTKGIREIIVRWLNEEL